MRPADEPAGFDRDVRMPGLRAIAELVGEEPELARTAGRPFQKVADRREDIEPRRFPKYWVAAIDDLMSAYERVCAYSCFRIHPVTGGRSVDHMAPKSRYWEQIYEWRNYRLACSLLNARKRDFSDVLDPFEVENGWFELELVGFQVRPGRGLNRETRAKVVATIERLGLDDFRDSRARDAELYWSGEISLAVLIEESPFVARELRRQGRLNTGDS